MFPRAWGSLIHVLKTGEIPVLTEARADADHAEHYDFMP